MATLTQESTNSNQPKRRMIRLRPSQDLGERFPAMHLVRSSWFARGLARTLLLLMILLLVAAIFLPWQQTSIGEGQVTARLQQLQLQAVDRPAKGINASL